MARTKYPPLREQRLGGTLQGLNSGRDRIAQQEACPEWKEEQCGLKLALQRLQKFLAIDKTWKGLEVL